MRADLSIFSDTLSDLSQSSQFFHDVHDLFTKGSQIVQHFPRRIWYHDCVRYKTRQSPPSLFSQKGSPPARAGGFSFPRAPGRRTGLLPSCEFTISSQKVLSSSTISRGRAGIMIVSGARPDTSPPSLFSPNMGSPPADAGGLPMSSIRRPAGKAWTEAGKTARPAQRAWPFVWTAARAARPRPPPEHGHAAGFTQPSFPDGRP